MPRQLEIDFSAGEQPRKLIKARVQDLANSSLNENKSDIPLPGNIAETEIEHKSPESSISRRRYRVSSLF